jgi:hypothetical protein
MENLNKKQVSKETTETTQKVTKPVEQKNGNHGKQVSEKTNYKSEKKGTSDIE